MPYFIIWDCIVVQCCVVYIVKCISYLLIGPTQNTSHHRRLLFGRSRAGAVGQKLVGGVLAANLGVVRCGNIFWAENTFLVWLSISIPPYSKYVYHYTPSGKHTKETDGKITMLCSWVNPRTKWPFSIAFCMFTRPGNDHHVIAVAWRTPFQQRLLVFFGGQLRTGKQTMGKYGNICYTWRFWWEFMGIICG